MSTMTDIAAASPFASAKRADRPRRNRLDLCRDDRGQWWQAIIGVVNGTVVVKAIPVPPRGGKKNKPQLRITR